MKHPRVCHEKANNCPCYRGSFVERGIQGNRRNGGDEFPFLGDTRPRGSISGVGASIGVGGQGQRSRAEGMGAAWATGGSGRADGRVESGMATGMVERLKITEKMRATMQEYNREMMEEIEKEMKEMRRHQNP